MAYTAGYYFKCPFCTNIKKFYKYVRESGIYIPEQEASWEREPSAYSDYTVELKCVAEPCICPKGNLYNRSNTKWNLKSCNTCGGNAIHSDCFKKLKRSDFTIYWQCSDCIPSRADHTTSIGVGNSTYGYSSCDNMDVTCTLADENAPVQEENADYENRRVEMEPLQKRGQLVTDLKRYTENNNENLVFVDSNFLNETLKIVSYNVEVIVDNKRCIVSLNKLNNDTVIDEQSDVSEKSS